MFLAFAFFILMEFQKTHKPGLGLFTTIGLGYAQVYGLQETDFGMLVGDKTNPLVIAREAPAPARQKVISEVPYIP